VPVTTRGSLLSLMGCGGSGGGASPPPPPPPTVYLQADLQDQTGSLATYTCQTGGPFTLDAGAWLTTIGLGARDPGGADGDTAHADAGHGDYTMHTNIVCNNAAGDQVAGIIFRFTDTTHYWLLHAVCTTGLVTVFRNNGGFVSVASISTTVPPNTPVSVVVRCSGSTIDCTYNGIALPTVTDSFNASATIVGLRLGFVSGIAAHAVWDHLLVIP